MISCREDVHPARPEDIARKHRGLREDPPPWIDRSYRCHSVVLVVKENTSVAPYNVGPARGEGVLVQDGEGGLAVQGSDYHGSGIDVVEQEHVPSRHGTTDNRAESTSKLHGFLQFEAKQNCQSAPQIGYLASCELISH